MKFISKFLFSIMVTTTAMGSSLPLPQPEDLVGDWVLSYARQFCAIHLWIDEMPQANGYRLTIDARAGACSFPMDAVAWRPAPDGISLLDHEGTTLVFFSQEAGGYRSNIASEEGMRLQRKKTGE
ncbi:MAG: AprI/Inh family metalloprotease inhibitor [Comamonas sp.]|uniref:AprI/Inh family metalloprotease inhibitor n=1 Tax=Comamonas sp. TaxID=34028 RepID=UPI002FC7D8A8